MTKRICPVGAAEGCRAGLQELQQELDFVLDAAGVPVDMQASGEDAGVAWDGQRAVITCAGRAHFFRLFTILLERMDDGPFTLRETPCFDKSGAMFDCSRNAVLTVQGFQGLLRRMAMMGLNLAMLYTEDTYTVPGEPYFGYLRGRYSAEELRSLDDYADRFGIELIPCIQALAHLEKFLRWSAAQRFADTPNVLLCDDEEVLALIGRCIDAASSCLRSRRIHLGMDEAWGIGSGNHLLRHGYEPTIEILRRHMKAVVDMCEARGLQPMIWSDMFLRPLSPRDAYYDFADDVGEVTPELAAAVPPSLQLVYWDYYHHTEREYEIMLRRHRQFGRHLLFAGGCWNWSGPVPNYGKTFDTTAKALAVCRREGIREVFCTVWGDDGAESNLTNSLLGLQLYAEYTYAPQAPTQAEVFRAFRRCCQADGQAFYDLRLLEELPGVPEGNPDVVTPTKAILYQDVLMGLLDKHFEEQVRLHGSMAAWYRERRAALAQAAQANPLYARHFRLYEAMADILADKAEVGLAIRAAYAARDTAAMQAQVQLLQGLLPKYDRLLLCWEEVWMSTNKPFGFDVISTRLGGTRGRIAYAAHRLSDWLQGKVKTLPELEEELLYFDGRTQPEKNGTPLLCACIWSRVATACPM